MISLDDIRLEELPEHFKVLAASAQRQADVSFAASQLASRRHELGTRPPRVYTGRLFGRRAWRGARVVLPNGQIGILYRAVRGTAVVTWRDEFALRPDQYAAVDVSELKPFKLPAAMIMGAAKRGVKERQSLRKALAARANGSAPTRPGSRPRGRPRKNQAARTAPLVSS